MFIVILKLKYPLKCARVTSGNSAPIATFKELCRIEYSNVSCLTLDCLGGNCRLRWNQKARKKIRLFWKKTNKIFAVDLCH